MRVLPADVQEWSVIRTDVLQTDTPTVTHIATGTCAHACEAFRGVIDGDLAGL